MFLSYDGMTEPLGQSQVLAYLEGLSKLGHQIHLFSFEKQSDFEKHGNQIDERTKKADIRWHSFIYTKKPPILSTMYDLYRAWLLAKKLHATAQFDIVHGRGYMTSIVARAMQKKFGVKFIFDMRGWWPDEKLESGNWGSPMFRPVYDYYKKKETEYFLNADCTISLTHAGKAEIIRLHQKAEQSIPVIPTCVNFDFFPPFSTLVQDEVRRELNIPAAAKVLVYSGSVGGNYKPEILFKVFSKLHQADGNWMLLILSNADKNFIQDEMNKHGIEQQLVRIKGVSYKDVSRYLMCGDAGFIFYNVSFSVIGRSPTKMAEYWASGLPVLGLSGIGDLDFLIHKFAESGVLISENSDVDFSLVSQQLIAYANRKEQLRKYAMEYFDVKNGIEAYNKVYQSL